MTDTNQEPDTRKVSEMAAFDALPARVREALNYGQKSYRATNVLRALRDGYSPARIISLCGKVEKYDR